MARLCQNLPCTTVHQSCHHCCASQVRSQSIMLCTGISCLQTGHHPPASFPCKGNRHFPAFRFTQWIKFLQRRQRHARFNSFGTQSLYYPHLARAVILFRRFVQFQINFSADSFHLNPPGF